MVVVTPVELVVEVATDVSAGGTLEDEVDEGGDVLVVEVSKELVVGVVDDGDVSALVDVDSDCVDDVASVVVGQP